MPVELKQNGAGVEFSVEVGEIVSVVNTNELDCAVVEVGIKFDVSHDNDDEIIPYEFKQNVAGVEFSVEVSEIVSVVNTNEFDWSVVEMGIRSKIHMMLMMKLYRLN